MRKRKLTGLERFKFDFSWFCVLWVGMLLFAHIDGMREAFTGQAALILYLTYCLYHTLQMLNRAIYRALAHVQAKWQGKKFTHFS
jgi:hypothetical protein